MKPDHIHGAAFSATMLLKPTVRRLNAANAFATGHDKQVYRAAFESTRSAERLDILSQ